MDTDAQDDVPTTSRLLEDIRRRLLRAFQRAVPRAGSRRAREAAEAAAEAASEERGWARVEGALAGLRAELIFSSAKCLPVCRTVGLVCCCDAGSYATGIQIPAGSPVEDRFQLSFQTKTDLEEGLSSLLLKRFSQ
ncbi:alanine and arginine-rich domain-containing protein isoform X1 [Elephas maximus indicus]|uniref:alanine and arginine-rich domain-containing protein isoform X1 n=1 Tax=Elephas maximus indicus TaxID=99487 RepID=UPI0021160D0B|nr:alanine and arginine-rich domain-containing protein isoform X1 [Elephas maximus indicus]